MAAGTNCTNSSSAASKGNHMLKGLYSIITFLTLASLTIVGAILKLCGLLLLSWWILALIAAAAITFLALAANEIW